MPDVQPYSLDISTQFTEKELSKDAWIVVLHASRVPPHVGILISGKYSSLTIKGQELGIDLEVLLRTINQKNIQTLFIKLKLNPVFSLDFQQSIFHHYIQQFPKVQSQQASCLSPIKLFLQEFYLIQAEKELLLFELIEKLKANHYIIKTIALNMDDILTNSRFYLPLYSYEQLNQIIEQESVKSTLKAN